MAVVVVKTASRVIRCVNQIENELRYRDFQPVPDTPAKLVGPGGVDSSCVSYERTYAKIVNVKTGKCK